MRRRLPALETNTEKGDRLRVAFSLEGLAPAMLDHGDDAARRSAQ